MDPNQHRGRSGHWSNSEGSFRGHFRYQSSSSGYRPRPSGGSYDRQSSRHYPNSRPDYTSRSDYNSRDSRPPPFIRKWSNFGPGADPPRDSSFDRRPPLLHNPPPILRHSHSGSSAPSRWQSSTRTPQASPINQYRGSSTLVRTSAGETRRVTMESSARATLSANGSKPKSNVEPLIPEVQIKQELIEEHIESSADKLEVHEPKEPDPVAKNNEKIIIKVMEVPRVKKDQKDQPDIALEESKADTPSEVIQDMEVQVESSIPVQVEACKPSTSQVDTPLQDTKEKRSEDVEMGDESQAEVEPNDVQTKEDVKPEASAAAKKQTAKPSAKEATGLLGSVMKTDLGEILRRSSRERKTNTRIIQDSIVPGMKLTDHVKVAKTAKQQSATSWMLTDTGAARTNVILRKDPKLKQSKHSSLPQPAEVPTTSEEPSPSTTGGVVTCASFVQGGSVAKDDHQLSIKDIAIDGGKLLVVKARAAFPLDKTIASPDLVTTASKLDTQVAVSTPSASTCEPPPKPTEEMPSSTLLEPKEQQQQQQQPPPQENVATTSNVQGKAAERRQKTRHFKGSTYQLSLRRARRRTKKQDDSLPGQEQEEQEDGDGDDDDDDGGSMTSGVNDVSMEEAEPGETPAKETENTKSTTASSANAGAIAPPLSSTPQSCIVPAQTDIEVDSNATVERPGDDPERVLVIDERMDVESESDDVRVVEPAVVQKSVAVTVDLTSPVIADNLKGFVERFCADDKGGMKVMKRKQSADDVTVLSPKESPNKKVLSPVSIATKDLPLSQPLRIPILHSGDFKRVPTVTLHQPTPLLCTCRTTDGSHLTLEPTKGHFCQGIDCIDNRLIGCVNAVCLQELLRPAARVPFQSLCEIHRQRLKLHQCCPGCGLFCSQGTFIQCRADPRKTIHHSHKDCLLIKDNKEICPHCGDGSNLQDVSLELNAPRPPSFFHKQQPVRKEPGARMAFTKGNESIQSSDAPESPTFRSYLIDQTGTEITSAGLPMGPDRSQLEGVLHNLSKQKPSTLRYTVKHMYSAAKNGEVEKILQMLVMGLDPNTKFEEQDNCTALHLAAANGHLALVHVLIQACAYLDALDDLLQTPLLYAIGAGQGKICEYLIKAGAQLEARAEEGMTALHLASKAGQLEIVKQILDTGKVNINIQDDGGWTPLVWAAEFKHLVVVKYLLKRGGDPNIRDNERNIALHWSSFSGSIEISETFLNHGCDLNSANEHGDTPLHIAARQDKYECVMLLLARSADVDAQNKEGETPPMCCPDTTSQTWLALSMTKHLKKISVSRTLRTERILHQDISRGKEQSPIQCINGVDDEPAPADYLYIIENCETAPVNVERSISTLQSCRCEDDCTSTNCQCSTMSLKCWFDKDGRLVDTFNIFDPPMIFECNRACLCWATCHNRVLQRGVTCRLQLFRTKGKGWGVRALKDIAKGTFICEYIGELISDLEADQREDDSYLFDLDNRDGETYCIDARRYGNISRFINHLCEPNLVPVKVFIEYQDLRFPRIALFSSRNIRAYEELGFDYGDKFWVIKYKMFTCTCASDRCKYSTKTIHTTLANYDKRLREEQEENAAAEH